jgi:hypothetical protein
MIKVIDSNSEPSSYCSRIPVEDTDGILYDPPVIVLSIDEISLQANRLSVEYSTIREITLAHEMGHALRYLEGKNPLTSNRSSLQSNSPISQSERGLSLEARIFLQLEEEIAAWDIASSIYEGDMELFNRYKLYCLETHCDYQVSLAEELLKLVTRGQHLLKECEEVSLRLNRY